MHLPALVKSRSPSARSTKKIDFSKIFFQISVTGGLTEKWINCVMISPGLFNRNHEKAVVASELISSFIFLTHSMFFYLSLYLIDL